MAVSQSIANLFQENFKEDVKISKISASLKGKSIVVYGGNNVGKTTQVARLKNPVFMPFEKGMNAIAGSLVLKNANWADVKRNIKKLSAKKFLDALASGEQITVIWDGFERAGFYCQRYIEQKYDAFDVADARGGFGAWGQYEKEFWTEVDKLLNIGYTVVFIGHAAINKEKGDKLFPKGDKLCISPIVDNADIVVYVEANGIDDKGEEILSSGYLVETRDFFARCRFPYVQNVIDEFTAENFETAVIEGIEKQIESEGLESVDFTEQQEIYKGDDYDHPTLLKLINDLYKKLKALDALNDYEDIVIQYLGEGVAVSSTSTKQIEPLICIKEALEDLIVEIEGEE